MKLLLLLTSAIALPSFAAGGGDLSITDTVGISFWLVTAAMLASTVFRYIDWLEFFKNCDCAFFSRPCYPFKRCFFGEDGFERGSFK
jgi:hypothetical protein